MDCIFYQSHIIRGISVQILCSSVAINDWVDKCLTIDRLMRSVVLHRIMRRLEIGLQKAIDAIRDCVKVQ